MQKILFVCVGHKGKVAIFSLLFLAVGFVLLSKRQDVQKAKKGRLVEAIYGLGTVSAEQVFTAKTGVSLQLQQLPVKEGDRVKTGQMLARFDESTLYAPFDGTVTQIGFKPGEIVSPQSPVLTITNLDRLYLEVSLEQQSVIRVEPGKEVAVSFESMREKRFQGTVKNVYPRDQQFIVRIELDQWPHGVLPGMTADVAIQANAKENALLIPVKAVEAGKVEFVRDGETKRANVTLGLISGEWAEVVAGDILPGDELFLQGQ
jgi:macrolide-specific efflux system membrane fusion protein